MKEGTALFEILAGHLANGEAGELLSFVATIWEIQMQYFALKDFDSGANCSLLWKALRSGKIQTMRRKTPVKAF